MTTEVSSRLVIMRGLPGSGKSTLAKKILSNEDGAYYNSFYMSTDLLFHTNGIYACAMELSKLDEFTKKPYNFDFKKLGHYHTKTFADFCETAAMIYNHEMVAQIILDNTNTQYKEFSHYVVVAKKLGFEIVQKIPDTPWSFDVDECFVKNSHGVPKETLVKMKERFQDFDSIQSIIGGLK